MGVFVLAGFVSQIFRAISTLTTDPGAGDWCPLILMCLGVRLMLFGKEDGRRCTKHHGPQYISSREHTTSAGSEKDPQVPYILTSEVIFLRNLSESQRNINKFLTFKMCDEPQSSPPAYEQEMF